MLLTCKHFYPQSSRRSRYHRRWSLSSPSLSLVQTNLVRSPRQLRRRRRTLRICHAASSLQQRFHLHCSKFSNLAGLRPKKWWTQVSSVLEPIWLGVEGIPAPKHSIQAAVLDSWRIIILQLTNDLTSAVTGLVSHTPHCPAGAAYFVVKEFR